MSKTFTVQDVINVTENDDSTSAQSLDWFMEQAKLKPFKGASSVFIQEHGNSDADLIISIEAYDDDFYDATDTSVKLDAFRDRVYKYLAKLFPDMTIFVVWYSGYTFHTFHVLETNNAQVKIF